MDTIWKTVRVFISSTFLDMQSERDHLVRFVFPRLREELLKRRIHLIDVDLRWGVTSEQDALAICREIIDECHPRFLCILGGRYGWVPPGKTRSITADEVYYGVLDRTSNERGFAYFYFRDDVATAAMVETTPGEFLEPQGSDNQNKLLEFKKTIVAAGLNPSTYPAQWDHESRCLTGLKSFGDLVYEGLLASMKTDPGLRDRFITDEMEQLNEFAEANAAMEAFIEERSERFVLGSREPVLDELLAHARAIGGNGYICLTGSPGSGKSAMLAHLSQHSTLNQDSTLLIRHFVGSSPDSTDVRHTLRRLCYELKAGCSDITADIPDDSEKLRVAFPEFLRKASARQHVIVLLEAIDQLDPTSGVSRFYWLPEELPDNARIILSALDGPALEELRHRPYKPREIELKPLTRADAQAIIEQFRQRYRKQFEPDQQAALLAKADAGTPLYLLAALEELRTLGTYEEITQRIAELPSTTQELFAWTLERLESEDGFRDAAGRLVGRELVSRFATLLGASRHGLSQRELADLLDAGDPKGNVAALLHLLRPYLMRRGELIGFYHGQFRAAAENIYLNTDKQRHAAHEILASYFGAQPLTKRKIEELPWQLERAGSWLRLSDTLRDLQFNKAAWGADRFEVTRYWAQVERHSHRRLADAFRDLADTPIREENADLVWNAARLLDDSGHGGQSLALWRALIDYGRRTRDQHRLGGALGNAAIRLKDLGELDAATELLKEQELICLAHGDNYGLQNSLGNQGLVAARQGRLDDAIALHKAKERICREIGHQLGVAASLGNQALILAVRDPVAALALHHEEMQICDAIGDRAGIARSLRNQALIYENLENIDLALARLRDSGRVCSELGNKVELAKCLMDLARVVQMQPSIKSEPEALLKYGQAEVIYREIGDREGLARCLHGVSRVHILLNQPEQAITCLDEAQDLFRECGHTNGIEACVLNRAAWMLGWNYPSGALELLFAQEARLRESGNDEYLVQCLLTQAPILMRGGDLGQAMEKAIESEVLCRKMGDKRRLAIALAYQVNIRDVAVRPGETGRL